MSDEREPLLATERGEEGTSSHPIESTEHPQPTYAAPSRVRSGRFTFLEKVLFALTVAFFILLCVFAGLYARRVYDEHDKVPAPEPTSPPDKPRENITEPLCSTPQCVLTASQILKDIDMTVDPCEDFYAYTCNNWIKTHDIPEAKPSISSFAQLATDNKEVLHGILTHDFQEFYERTHGSTGGLPDPEKLVDKQNFNKVKALYDSCMDEQAIDARGAEPLLPLLRELRRLYPSDFAAVNADTMPKATENTQTLTQAMSFLFKHNVGALFEIMIDADPRNPEKTALQLYQSGLTLPSKEYYQEEDIVQTLFETVADTMDAVFGATNNEFGWNRWSANTTARLVVDFEKRLANISARPEELMDPDATYNPRSLSQLHKLAPTLDWGLMISELLPSTAPHVDMLIVSSPEYIEKLHTELLDASTTRTVQAYFMWRLIRSYSDALAEDIRKPVQRLTAKLRGTNAKVTKPRWEICLDEVNASLGFMAGRYYVLDKFSGSSKKRADEFVQSIEEVFVDRLPELTWIDNVTRARAEEKVDNLMLKVGFPSAYPDVMSPVSLSDYYSELRMEPDSYFKNYLKSRTWDIVEQWRQVGKPPNKSKWLMNPQEVNAYYNPVFNEIVFPAGILQNPFFGNEYPDYLNYGGIGVVVGHELTHGFDNSGRHYDAEGRLVQWWTNETSKSFDEKAQCFVDQYSNFTVEGNNGRVVHVNGKLTLGENLADNGGLGEAYLAWKQRYDSDRQSKKYNNARLPGLDNLTPEQLFFVNFGRIWCSKSTKEQAVQSALTDEHSPPKWRVNGAVQNSKHFANVFQCPVGTAMNPAKKCELW